MTTPDNTPTMAKQDMPPKTPSTVTYKRHLPRIGPPAWTLIVGMLGLSALGVFNQKRKTHSRWEVRREASQADILLQCLLFDAENDLRSMHSYLSTMKQRI